MSAGWVAGNVRAKAMLNRRVGVTRARELASAESLSAAQQLLSDTSYRRDVLVGQTLPESEYGLNANLLWQLRVLAGWQPPTGAGVIRMLAGGFEVANICAHARALAGGETERAYVLGGLSLVWPRIAATTSLAELRSALAASPWGDPIADTPADIATAVNLAWARRVAAGAPDAANWARAAVALMLARTLLVDRKPLPPSVADHAVRLLGTGCGNAADLPELAACVPADARWALHGVTSTDELWRAEFGWWAHVEQDAQVLLSHSRFDAAAPIATVALLAADVWRVRAALQLAAAGGAGLEVYDALV